MSPRTVQSEAYDDLGYPFMTILEENTPDAFKASLRDSKQFLDQSGVDIVTINAWNEWTEGSYLEPDETHGMSYLAAIEDVFGGDRD